MDTCFGSGDIVGGGADHAGLYAPFGGGLYTGG